MTQKVTYSLTGNRFSIGRSFHKMVNHKDAGLVTDVKLTRIAMFKWHLQFKIEVQS